jgi:hypothetical protein
MAFSDNLSDLEHLIADAMGNALEGARRALSDQIRKRSESGLRDARERGFRDLREATARLDGARTQAEVLSALLEEGGKFASRTALFLTFADGARGWAAYGFSDATQGLEDLRLSYDEDGLGKLAAGRGAVNLSPEESTALAQHLGGGSPAAGVLVPLVLHDRIAAALYADQLRGSDVFVPAALQLLVYTAAQVLEAQGARARASTPTLVFADQEPAEAGAGAALPLWDPAAMAAAAASAAAAPAATRAPEPAPPAAEPDDVSVTARTVSMTRPSAAPRAPEPIPEPAAPEPPPAPAPWEEVPEEAAWADSSTAPEAVEEPAPAWQPSWQMEEAPAAEPAPEAAQEEAWVYTDQGYEEQPAYEAEATYEEEAVVAGPTDDTLVEEIPAEPVEAAAEAALPWQSPPAARAEAVESPESTTSPLYAGPLYPSEATVRISRDLLPASAAATPPEVAEEPAARPQPPAPAAAPPPPAPPVPAPVDQAPAPPAPPSRQPTVFGGGGSTEVQAPPDLEGPGWAFRTGDASTASYRQQTEENTGLHEEARRLARLLVSEIKLYNEEQVEEGRRQRDIYPRLQEDIDRSRQMYEERVDPRVRDEVDYFHQEMINILAGGDSGALGM